jgi:hypothetical protein
MLTDSSPFPIYEDFAIASLLLLWLSFFEIETISLNLLCQLSYLFEIKEGNSIFRSILIIISFYSFLSTFLTVWWGILRLVTAIVARDC